MESAPIPTWERRVVGRLVRTLFLRDRRGGPWDPPAHLASEPLAFEGNTGARLVGTWFPAERPRGAVVLAHPDRRYGQRWFARVGWLDFLHDAGYDALTFDFPGYGESRGPATYFHEDVLAAVGVARRWAGGLPVHVVGVSMGAFAAANAAPRLDGVDALVLESPYPSFGAWYGRGWRRWAIGAFDRAFPRSSATIQADRNLARSKARRHLVVAAGADEVTPPALTRTVARAADPERTRCVVVDGARHLEPFVASESYRRAILATLAGERSRPSYSGSPLAASQPGLVV